jgi:CRP/FNR family transcriptional regulator, cyclic AMP receptor protein
MARVRLLEAVPELGGGLEGERAAMARRALVVETEVLPEGPWVPVRNEPEPGALGFVIVDGVMGRRLTVAGASSIELLNRGDLLRPWQEDSASFATAEWLVLDRITLANLDRRFAVQASRWPEIVAQLLNQAMQRSRSLAVHAAIENLVGLDKRLRVLFWHLAERWGRREGDAIVLPMRLTHQVLATLVGARRPSVTMALGELQDEGVLERRGKDWVLKGPPPRPGEDGAVSAAGESSRVEAS